jgi:hypothetical protein
VIGAVTRNLLRTCAKRCSMKPDPSATASGRERVSADSHRSTAMSVWRTE